MPIDDGSNQWSAVHRYDAARLIRLGLEQAPAGTRMHAVAEQAIETRAIAEALGQALDIPVRSIPAADADADADADEHFGMVAHFFNQTMTAFSDRTRELLS